jgi:RNA methyltransferase, TrmH family
MPETIKITSRNNERLIHVRKVRDGKVPDQIFIEGARLAEEALRSNVELVEGVFTPIFLNADRGMQFLDELNARYVRTAEISDRLFKSVADTTHSQGIALIARKPECGPERIIIKGTYPREPHLVVYLHEVNDPSNLGAVFRTAEAVGVSGIILSKGTADAFSPKSLRAGMGANLRVPIWDNAETADCIEWARRQGIRVVAADIKGKVSYANIDWRVPSLLMFGSEAHGLDDSVIQLADEIVNIPMMNDVESLNLAVSAGIILFEAVRQNS